ncbi:Uncharacterised protein [Legionella pneumophila]|nr:hypothetical protein ULM_26620 [Legionella pneumophila]CZF99861.1 Uncharacterised protein [Legionella pneumophila]CZG00817.1 Uncharacterised protein [Legionella pneumophila]CZG09397.1 Uncharacterised protein [Legionella pneumophila]CZG13842.1 Uncharacterised protein [Legionella pneumophila]
MENCLMMRSEEKNYQHTSDLMLFRGIFIMKQLDVTWSTQMLHPS